MLSLRSIAGWEEAILASISGAQGTLEERDRQIERSGVYAEYPAIVHAYQELMDDPDSSLEAVKRALFLMWRGATGLPAITAIAPLPDQTMHAVVDAVATRVRREAFDDELEWMLVWYHSQSPDLLDLYGATSGTLQLATARPADSWRRAGITSEQMALRGQMGRYWSAMVAGAP
ncbi:MAG: hypothetical protein V4550_04710 [Gemmatimonadota bacterium]